MTTTITVQQTIYDVTDLLDELISLRTLAQSRNERAMVMRLSFNEETQQVEITVELREKEWDWLLENEEKQAV